MKNLFHIFRDNPNGRLVIGSTQTLETPLVVKLTGSKSTERFRHLQSHSARNYLCPGGRGGGCQRLIRVRAMRGAILALLLLLGASAARAQTYVAGSVTGVFVGSGSGTTLSVALHQTPGAGHLLICAATWQSSTATVTFSDPNNGRWTAVGSPKAGINTLTGYSGQMFYVASAAALATTVTMTVSTSVSFRSFECAEYSYGGTLSVDGAAQYNTNPSVGGVATISGLSTSNPADTIIAACLGVTGSCSAGSGYTFRNDTNSVNTGNNTIGNNFVTITGQGVEDQTGLPVGAQTFGNTIATGDVILGMIAFRSTGGSGEQSYTTNVPLTEDLISESGKWINGGTIGLDWGNVETTSGKAFGVSISANYGDATAVLSGTWGPNQNVQSTVKIIGLPTQTLEVEVRLNTTITAHSITGYEIDCSLNPSNPYLLIVRWNGPLANFTPLTSNAPVYCQNGDVLSAASNGGVITAFLNGVQEVQATDTTYTGGSPGIGFDGPGPFPASSYLNQFGFSSFKASASGGGGEGSRIGFMSAP
jgi:hypothetical protein